MTKEGGNKSTTNKRQKHWLFLTSVGKIANLQTHRHSHIQIYRHTQWQTEMQAAWVQRMYELKKRRWVEGPISRKGGLSHWNSKPASYTNRALRQILCASLNKMPHTVVAGKNETTVLKKKPKLQEYQPFPNKALLKSMRSGGVQTAVIKMSERVRGSKRCNNTLDSKPREKAQTMLSSNWWVLCESEEWLKKVKAVRDGRKAERENSACLGSRCM